MHAASSGIVGIVRQSASAPLAAGGTSSSSQDEAFVAEQYPRVFAWFCSLTGARDRAADLTQESFAAFWESRRTRQIEQPVVWLFRIARNRWRLSLRRRARTPVVTTIDETVAMTAAEEPNRESRIREFVLELPPKLRNAIVLSYWCDLSPSEIGRVLSVPAALVRWRLHHARKFLSRRLATPENAEGER